MASNPILNERYHLLEQVGAGGMAVIYRAQDLVLGRIVAVKILRPSLVDNPQFLIRFRREAQSAANLSHPNIVTVYDVGQDGPNTHFIVMEYIDGQNLKLQLRSAGHFEVEQALRIIIDVSKGVGYAHRAGLVHCDVKPQNILITSGGIVKVADFGIARAMSRIDDEKEYWGSPHYFSPEQAMGHPPTPASDVYSIGITLFEALTGRLPFTGVNYQELALAHLKDTPPSILEYNPSLPGELDEIIQKVLNKEPANRYRTGDQFGRILQNHLNNCVQLTRNVNSIPINVLSSEADTPNNNIIDDMTEPNSINSLDLENNDRGGDTIPSLPPIDMEEAIGKARGNRTSESEEPPYAFSDESVDDVTEELPSNLENIVLSILAIVAVLGLIPLWISVFISLFG